MNTLKYLAKGLSLALLIGLSATSYADNTPPQFFIVHNKADIGTTVFVHGNEGPIVRKHTDKNIPWDTVTSLCGSDVLCNADVVGLKPNGEPYVHIAEARMNIKTGKIISVEMQDRHFMVHVDGIAEVTVDNIVLD